MYEAINDVLLRRNADLEAAEAHGMATGMLSVTIQADAENWLRELLSADENLSADQISLLHNLFEQTRQALLNETGEFHFDLLLPEDDAPLNEQAEALRYWCQGFIFGVGYTHSKREWNEDPGEIMRDLIELTKLDSDIQDEADAFALMEIREYVRAAVFTLSDYFMETETGKIH